MHIKPFHLIEVPHELRIHEEYAPGVPSGVALRIGSTALCFRAPRSGSHRGEKMVYGQFADGDVARARLLAAAPELLAACKAVLSSPRHGDTPSQEAVELVRAAVAKAEGRS